MKLLTIKQKICMVLAVVLWAGSVWVTANTEDFSLATIGIAGMFCVVIPFWLICAAVVLRTLGMDNKRSRG